MSVTGVVLVTLDDLIQIEPMVFVLPCPKVIKSIRSTLDMGMGIFPKKQRICLNTRYSKYLCKAVLTFAKIAATVGVA